MIYANPLIVLVGIALLLGIILALADHFFANYGDCKIEVNSDKELIVKGGNTLLAGLLDNKIFLPSACGGRATCGFCKCKVNSGGGAILPTELPFLSKHEKKDGTRMACQIKIRSDIDIAIPETLLSVKEFKTTVEEINDLTHDIKEVVMKLAEPETISFKPGQYIQYQIPDTVEYRAYSVSSIPSQTDRVEIITRLVPEGVCTTYLHNVLSEGDEAVVTGPYGEFYLQEDSEKEIVCIAGGSGLAPIKSIVFHLFEKGTNRKITFFFGAREVKDLYYRKEFEKLAEEHENFNYVPALSNPVPADNWTGETGFVHLCLKNHLDKTSEKEAYLCGPPVMIDASVSALQVFGINDKDIYFDKF